MEKNGETNGCPKNACKKMYKAMSNCPAVQAIRRVAYRPQGFATPPPPNPPAKNINNLLEPDSIKHHKEREDTQLHNHNERKNGEAAEVVPMVFDYPNLQPPAREKPKPAASNRESEASPRANILGGKISLQANARSEAPDVSKEHGNKSGVHIEDRFTDYINRAKIRIRTMTNVGHHDEAKTSGKDQRKALGKHRGDNAFVKDKFTEYINRAKIKMRSTSSIGVGKHNSFK